MRMHMDEPVESRLYYVLVIDDHDLRRQWTKRALTKKPFRVRTTSSAGEGLRYLRQCRFDAVVVGAHLRGVGAHSLTAMIQKKYPGTPVIVTSFQWPIGRTLKSMTPGAYHCLVLCTQDKEKALQEMVEKAVTDPAAEVLTANCHNSRSRAVK